jgi:hypothetical protein
MEKLNLIHDADRYENIFNMYQFNNENGDTYAFYNILSKVTLPSDLDDRIFEYVKVESEMPLTTLSYNLYTTQHLWWLILAVNNIVNPVKLLEAGSIIKVIKVDYLDLVFNAIKQKI